MQKRGKKGLSTIVITLIIILISLVAVGIIWVVVRNVIQSGTEGIALGQFTLGADIINVNVDNSSNNVSLSVKRSSGEGEITGIKFIFSDEADSEIITEKIAMSKLEEKRFTFHLTKLAVSKLISISIVPVLSSSSGKETLGSVLSKYNVQEGTSTEGGTGNQTTCTPNCTGRICGSDGCSGICGTCSTGTCNSTGGCVAGCVPATCVSLGRTCGTWQNGTCSGTSLFCGNCNSTSTCNSTGSCVASCTPAVCGTPGYMCGVVANGTCGTMNCGNCGTGYNCVSGGCVIQTGITCEAIGGAKCWYIDSTATGMNNGSNWTNAWQSFASINWLNIKPGDFIYISGGATSKTYTESWTVGASGNSTAQLTIKPGQNTGHNGMVIFDYNSYGDNALITGITINNRNYLTFKGTVGTESHFQIKNLRNIYSRTSYGIAGDGATGAIFDDLTFINMNNPIRITYARNATVKNSEFFQTRGDAAIQLLAMYDTAWDSNKVYNNYIEVAFNNSKPAGATYLYGGPDGIQCGNGISIYNNTFKVIKVPFYTSDQHPDDIQSVGYNVKIYNNEFINIGDSALDLAGDYSDPNLRDNWVYNNVFRITESIDTYPEYIRVYATAGYGIQSITNFKIFNNLFVDCANWTAVSFTGYILQPTASGNEIKNNIFYNDGLGEMNGEIGSLSINIANSSQFTSNSFSLDGNIYYNQKNTPHIFFRGINYAAPAWVSANEPKGKTIAPSFVSYVPYSASNNFHLSPSDTVAKDAGLSLSNYFTTDFDGVSRPRGVAWDIGPYEY